MINLPKLPLESRQEETGPRFGGRFLVPSSLESASYFLTVGDLSPLQFLFLLIFA